MDARSTKSVKTLPKSVDDALKNLVDEVDKHLKVKYGKTVLRSHLCEEIRRHTDTTQVRRG